MGGVSRFNKSGVGVTERKRITYTFTKIRYAPRTRLCKASLAPAESRDSIIDEIETW